MRMMKPMVLAGASQVAQLEKQMTRVRADAATDAAEAVGKLNSLSEEMARAKAQQRVAEEERVSLQAAVDEAQRRLESKLGKDAWLGVKEHMEETRRKERNESLQRELSEVVGAKAEAEARAVREAEKARAARGDLEEGATAWERERVSFEGRVRVAEERARRAEERASKAETDANERAAEAKAAQSVATKEEERAKQAEEKVRQARKEAMQSEERAKRADDDVRRGMENAQKAIEKLAKSDEKLEAARACAARLEERVGTLDSELASVRVELSAAQAAGEKHMHGLVAL